MNKHSFRVIFFIACGLFAVGRAQADAAGASFSDSSNFGWRDGEAIYQHVCQECHMADAKGASGAGSYPALAGDTRLASKIYPVFMVVNGKGAMPRLGEYMDDEQVAAVVNYVRSHFGNKYKDKASAADAKSVRPQVTETTDAK